MIHLKALLVGLLGAMVAPIVWLAVWVGGSLLVEAVGLRRELRGEGSGGIGAVSVGVNELEVLLATILGFAAGYWWVLRRARHARRVG